MATISDAIEFLRAEPEPGRSTYVYYAEETFGLHRVSVSDLLRLSELMLTHGHDAYSVWCSECPGEELVDE